MLLGGGALVVWRRRRPLEIFGFLIICVGVLSFGISWLAENRAMAGPPPEGFEGFIPIALIDFQRQIIWSFVFDKVFEAPWLGHGINTINFIAGAHVPVPGAGITFIPGHPHDWPLEVLAETGIPGFAALLLALIFFFRGITRAYMANGGAAPLTVILVGLAYWSSGLFNYSFWSAWWQVAYLLVTAMAFCLSEKPNTVAVEP